jgi:hypothetical protein
MREYYTPERVCDVLHQCNRFGINTCNSFPGGRGQADLERFLAEGGKMNLIAQGSWCSWRPLKEYRSASTVRGVSFGMLD